MMFIVNFAAQAYMEDELTLLCLPGELVKLDLEL